jgi:hypothetical protein
MRWQDQVHEQPDDRRDDGDDDERDDQADEGVNTERGHDQSLAIAGNQVH